VANQAFAAIVAEKTLRDDVRVRSADAQQQSGHFAVRKRTRYDRGMSSGAGPRSRKALVAVPLLPSSPGIVVVAVVLAQLHLARPGTPTVAAGDDRAG